MLRKCSQRDTRDGVTELHGYIPFIDVDAVVGGSGFGVDLSPFTSEQRFRGVFHSH